MALSGTMLPLLLRVLKFPMSRQLLAEGAIGLGGHAERAPQQVEVVDVGRAEIDLERLEDAIGRHADHVGADPVDIGVDLRRAGVEERENAGQPRRLIRPRHDVLRGRLERLQARGPPCPRPSS